MKLPLSDSLTKRIKRLVWEAIAELLAEASEVAREFGKGKTFDDIFNINDDVEFHVVPDAPNEKTDKQPGEVETVG
jgi:hypothetical protein